MLTRLTLTTGRAFFVHPDRVTAISPHGHEEGVCFVETGTTSHYKVKGTPESIHALLWPGRALGPLANVDSAVWALTQVVANYSARLPTNVVAEAQKALGLKAQEAA